ncbi:protein-disulfide isomerase [Bosea sp. BE271]|uniref:DsbA family protein n=1 Tax=Bosea TaxID=85413 RepID=UPI002861560D|nr:MULTISPECIES: thioredoxin domain-containing protein [Bosea]MDR6826316.1 protein-disulfide isomerase [Bosea robiniae]MDR6893026.1 protein-disulfide isomerase [Bosea sp. BE109]MDR7137276.1 protein-disulfide isomerase [Bosea sp. BE168]MDR7173976.1 protein-disulfide isomerase [Bosea sp. BE271]
MNRRILVILTGVFALAAFSGATIVYRNDQAERARAIAASRAEALIRDHSPIIGSANAPVTITEFFDPSCEACRAFYPPLKQILSLFPNDARLVIRYAAFHEGSDVAVKILEAARLQGKYQPVMEALLEFQPEWADHDKPDMEKAWMRAQAAGLDLERARLDAGRPEFQAMLDQDAADARALEVSRTPTFFVNGQPLIEFGPRPLYELVKREVDRARK